MRILHFNSQKYEDYIHECPPPHAEWSILTVINRAGYIKMKFSYSNHLAHAVRRAKVPVVKRDLFVSPGGYLEKQCEAAFWKCIERERDCDEFVTFGLRVSVACRQQTRRKSQLTLQRWIIWLWTVFGVQMWLDFSSAIKFWIHFWKCLVGNADPSQLFYHILTCGNNCERSRHFHSLQYTEPCKNRCRPSN